MCRRPVWPVSGMTSTSCWRSTTSLTMRTILAACGRVSDTRRRVGLEGREQLIVCDASHQPGRCLSFLFYGLQVPAQQFGLSTEDILLRSDRELNQVGSPLLRPASRVSRQYPLELSPSAAEPTITMVTLCDARPPPYCLVTSPPVHTLSAPLCPWPSRWLACGGWHPTRRTRHASDPTTRH